MPLRNIEIDVGEVFPPLPNAPITEAVVEVRSRAETVWDEHTIVAEVKSQLQDYPKLQSQHGLEQTVRIEFGKSAEQTLNDLGWSGIGVRSEDDKQVAQFHRDVFSFSRLRPYENWTRFRGEVLRLWSVYAALGTRTEAQRMGLRFINQIQIASASFDIDDYLITAPKDATNIPLPFVSFFHHDTFAVPGYPYGVNVIRTIQPATKITTGPVLILDIDVFTTIPFLLSDGALEHSLAEMRWLKNKIFFGSITQRTRDLFQ